MHAAYRYTFRNIPAWLFYVIQNTHKQAEIKSYTSYNLVIQFLELHTYIMYVTDVLYCIVCMYACTYMCSTVTTVHMLTSHLQVQVHINTSVAKKHSNIHAQTLITCNIKQALNVVFKCSNYSSFLYVTIRLILEPANTGKDSSGISNIKHLIQCLIKDANYGNTKIPTVDYKLYHVTVSLSDGVFFWCYQYCA